MGKGFESWLSATRCRQPHDVNLFNRERILSKVKILPKKYKKAGGKYSDLLKNRLYYKTFWIQKYSIQSSHFKFRIQNLRRRDQTGTFLLRIRPPVCQRQNEYGTKTFRIRV